MACAVVPSRQVVEYGNHNTNLLFLTFPSDILSYMFLSDLIHVYYNTTVVILWSLFYHSKSIHIPLPLLEGSYLHLPPLANPSLPDSSAVFHRHVIGSSAAVSSVLPLAAWRSPSASLHRCTGHEIATWVFKENSWQTVLCRRLSSPRMACPSALTKLTATWSIKLLLPFPRHPKHLNSRWRVF